jgi:hypothetical protein
MLSAMNAEPFDSDALEARWVTNERELNRIAAMPGLDREMHASKAECLEAEQDRVEWQVGCDRSKAAESRRWSGMA